MLKNVKKSLMAAAAIASIGTVAENNDSKTDPMSSLVDKIANRFNLNKADVQKVFDEERSTRQAEREAKISERLQKLVDEGTITADQKTKIEAKLKELKSEREANRDAFKNLSAEERKSKMEAKRTELENWAKENGIDLTKLMGIFMGGRGGHGPRN
jgi:hypothetical protein